MKSLAASDARAKKKRRYIGQSVTRLEDRPLLTGSARFVADLNFPRQLHMRVIRSAYAHGRIDGIELEEARGVPGVVAVWTAADLGDLPPIPFRATAIQGLPPYRQPVLACGVVRYVGEPVAVVFADCPYVAEDAAELVIPHIEPLPPYLDARATPPETAFPIPIRWRARPMRWTPRRSAVPG